MILVQLLIMKQPIIRYLLVYNKLQPYKLGHFIKNKHSTNIIYFIIGNLSS